MGSPEEASAGFWPEGFVTSAASAGIKYSGRSDMFLMLSDTAAATAGVFTTNLCSAAPVVLSRRHLESAGGAMRAIVCNSGNANAATGEEGMKDAETMARETARALGIEAREVLVSSTGVIGQLLPMDKVAAGIEALPAGLQKESGIESAEAIMTTDTFPKFFSLDVALSHGTARISGIAKGSGMIAPNMATMLAFMATDASIGHELLQEALRRANSSSFNAITVDGDTSTNDMAVIMAGGTGPSIEAGSGDLERFTLALESLMGFLARLIVIDGEGATKLVEINVRDAATEEEAAMAARTIATSNLVKTALHGEDANWGRIIAAAGRSGARFREEDLELFFEELPILRKGLRADFSEEEAAAILHRPSYALTLRLGAGSASARVWTCDLSKEYVDINGSYRS
ncbi:bifunctional glutamate N-acetyltransferase/amino-acid acetyltransferase ArgJ [Chlorobium sp. N1]|uniref:bifunctional glutamate N-acetyltransferase/amino-acid acetyltransferase ArgJ n=1 Tax=Chlorobium sp. N1 TaxID=2491138 RepID=UPI00103CEF3D|nr:bifunctional glutamate N-acetyltransferase/amino-acid acetyltransferase ArgJ [Chlorobium sp. N1]TCD47512.1 bifunctional glutamate N-acetyltransferase/amino-acid acetyltransferase ArgJ [Chlorobium sp. N1]